MMNTDIKNDNQCGCDIYWIKIIDRKITKILGNELINRES